MDRDEDRRIRRAYILAGGKSSRFGSPKSLVEIDGKPLIDRLCSALADRGIEPTIVAKSKFDFSRFSWNCIEDDEPDSGPLHGIQRSLEDCRASGDTLCWILTCDLLAWKPIWEHEVSRLEIEVLGKFDVILFQVEHRFMPFPGIYGVSCLESIQKSWIEGIRSIRSWQSTIHDRIMRIPLDRADSPQTFNTPEELAKFRPRA